MKNRGTLLLIVLFFGGLALLWALDRKGRNAGDPGETRLLPTFAALPDEQIQAVEIAGKTGTLRFERRGDDWQMVRPLRALADRSRLNGLVSTLRTLKARPDAGAAPGSATDYGLASPARTVSLFARNNVQQPASIRLGNVRRDFLYIGIGSDPTIHVVDSNGLVDLPPEAAAWRSREVFPVASHEVERLRLADKEQAFAVQHGVGTWKIVEPFLAPAEDPKVEGLVDTLLGLRVASEGGFVADDATNMKPYGLEPARSRIEVTTSRKDPVTRTLRLGDPIPGRPGFAYALLEGQDDVLAVDRSAIPPPGTLPLTLRSTEVADVDFDSATQLRVNVGTRDYVLTRQESGWMQSGPVKVAGDYRLIVDYLAYLGGLHALKIVPERETSGTGLNEPSAVIRIWHGTPGDGPPDVALKLGRFDPEEGVLYAQDEGEPNVLFLPPSARNLILHDPLALADRTIQRLPPGSLETITVARGGKSVTVKASEAARDDEHWTMTDPVKAAVGVQAASALDAVLSRLRAAELRPDASRSEAGLDQPWLRILWTLKDGTKGTLTVGSPVPDRDGARFAASSTADGIFTLAEPILSILDAELHDRSVLQIPENTINTISLTRNGSTRRWRREARVFQQSSWIPEEGAESREDIRTFAPSLANLQASRFLQYTGPFHLEWGLSADPLVIGVQVSSVATPARLRIGAKVGGDEYAATTEEGEEGAVFLLPGSVVEPLLPGPKLPADVFKAD